MPDDKLFIPGIGDITPPTVEQLQAAQEAALAQQLLLRLNVISTQLDYIIRMQCGQMKFHEMRDLFKQWEKEAAERALAAEPQGPADGGRGANDDGEDGANVVPLH